MPRMHQAPRVVSQPAVQVAGKGKGAQEAERLRGRKLQAARLRIWARDPRCQMCGELTDITPGTNRPFELDHKLALTNGGTNEDENLQVLCLDCHESKTAKDLGTSVKRRIGLDGWPVE